MNKDLGHLTEELIAQFEKIKSSKILPVEKLDGEEIKYDEQSIDKFIKDLVDKKYLISVCGVMNSGKSTLLNALIFNGKRVLPEGATPETATITELKYAEAPAADFEFYSKEEWDYVLEFYKNSQEIDYEKDIKPKVGKAQSEGIIEDVIEDDSKIMKEKNLDKLDRYLSKDGKYTIFVKRAVIYYPAEKLENTIFVDTPGTEDPNGVRSGLTEKFIGRSSATIMLIPKGKITQADIDFIDEFLMPIPSEKIQVVMNKIDKMQNKVSVEKYLRKNLPERITKHFLEGKVVGVSALGGLLKKRADQDLDLDEDAQWHLQNTFQGERTKFLDNEGNLNELSETINEKLLQSSEVEVLKKHKLTILSVWQSKIDVISSKVNEKKDDKEDYQSSRSELLEKKANLEDFEKGVLEGRKEIKRVYEINRDKSADKIDNIFESQMELARTKITEHIDNEWNEKKDKFFGRENALKDIAFRLDEKLRRIVHNHFRPSNIVNYENIIKSFEAEIERKTREFLGKHKNELTNLNALKPWSNPFEVNTKFRQLRKNVSDQDYGEVLVPDMFARFFVVKGLVAGFHDKEASIRELKRESVKQLGNMKNEIVDNIYQLVLKEWERGINNWFEELENVLANRVNRIDEITGNLDQTEEMVQRIEKEIDKFTKQKEKISALKEEVKNQMRKLPLE